jgi:hypothetical protein
MICNLCGVNAHTESVLSCYQTEKVKEVCSDCAGDLNDLKANCRKLSDKTTAKINRRAAKIASEKRSQNVFWSLISAGSVAIKKCLQSTRGKRHDHTNHTRID